jgi:alkanesulfonate monooxygenase SsuD/methylene tetrahydromethanopterin reductase-like flavin-dependent oxidoreductase (luciferase family)
MGDLVTTTPKPILGGTPSAKSSSRMMQDVGTSSWPAMGPRLADRIFLESAAQPRDAVFAADIRCRSAGFKRDPKSNAISFVIHVVAIAGSVAGAEGSHNRHAAAKHDCNAGRLQSSIPPMTLPVAKLAMGGGGGGGA